MLMGFAPTGWAFASWIALAFVARAWRGQRWPIASAVGLVFVLTTALFGLSWLPQGITGINGTSASAALPLVVAASLYNAAAWAVVLRAQRTPSPCSVCRHAARPRISSLPSGWPKRCAVRWKAW
jgi:apolipoprotein N-acyltransferase